MFKYDVISYYLDPRFGLTVVDFTAFEAPPTAEEIEQVVFETAADVVRVYHTNQFGKRVLTSETIYHDFDDAGDEGDFLYDDA